MNIWARWLKNKKKYGRNTPEVEHFKNCVKKVISTHKPEINFFSSLAFYVGNAVVKALLTGYLLYYYFLLVAFFKSALMINLIIMCNFWINKSEMKRDRKFFNSPYKSGF